jgi:hypothetical protein
MRERNQCGLAVNPKWMSLEHFEWIEPLLIQSNAGAGGRSESKRAPG